MSKTIGANLKAHLAGDVMSVAHCLKLVRKDATVLGFTDHDQDVVYDGVTYEASTAHNISALASSSNLAVDKVDVESVLDSSYITADDLRAGKYDFAEWYLFLLNWKDTTMGKMDLSRGWLGRVEIGKYKFFCEANSLFQALDQNIVELVSPACRANLGDARCGVVLASFTASGTVTSVASVRQIFSDSSRSEAAATFSQGKLTWLTGGNAGRSMEVKRFEAGGTFTLKSPMPDDVQVGDTYSVYYGCAKTKDDCINVFNNIDNFRGEPWLPGIGKMIKYGHR